MVVWAITGSFWVRSLSHCHILVSVLSGIMSLNLQVVFFSSIQHKHMSCHFITFRVYYVACFIYVIIYLLLVCPLTTTMGFSLVLTHWAHMSFSGISTVSTETNYSSVRNFVCWFISRSCVTFLKSVLSKSPPDGYDCFKTFPLLHLFAAILQLGSQSLQRWPSETDCTSVSHPLQQGCTA